MAVSRLPEASSAYLTILLLPAPTSTVSGAPVLIPKPNLVVSPRLQNTCPARRRKASGAKCGTRSHRKNPCF